MMFPQFGSDATIGAFMEIEHEHSREIIEIFSRSQALQRTLPLAAILVHARMRAPDKATRRRRDASNVGERLKRLSAVGDPLREHAATVGFKASWTELKQTLACSKRSRCGPPPPFDAATTFKTPAIQRANYLSDERTKFLIDEPFGRCVVSPGSAERSDPGPGPDTPSASARSPS